MNIQSVTFHNQEIQVLNHDGKPYVAMRSVVENIGLDWSSQHKRIIRNEILSSSMVMMTTEQISGVQRELLCLPLGMLNGWLFGIEINRCKPEIRDILRLYQLECFDVLYKHFMPIAEESFPSVVVTKDSSTGKNPKSERFYIEVKIVDNLTGGTMQMRKVAKTTNHMVTGFANDLGYKVCGLDMVTDPLAGEYEKKH
ncbi:MAG: phage antirepressor N-terminal domain-containing protein [Wohlfahrtiimonas sp.]